MTLIDASYTRGSRRVVLPSKRYESLSAKFLKERKILKQSDDVQV